MSFRGNIKSSFSQHSLLVWPAKLLPPASWYIRKQYQILRLAWLLALCVLLPFMW